MGGLWEAFGETFEDFGSPRASERSPKRCPRGAQEPPRGAQELSKGTLRDPLGWHFQEKNLSKIEYCFEQPFVHIFEGEFQIFDTILDYFWRSFSLTF